MDLSSSQGELAKACLLARVPYAGLTLSECHSTQLEVLLTQYVLSQMRTEGSTYYRADASAIGASGQGGQKRKNGEQEGEDQTETKPKKAKAKSKPKATPKASQTKDPDPETVEETEDAAGGEEDDLPW